MERSRSPRQAGQALELAGHVGQPHDIALEGLDETLALGSASLTRQNAGQHLQDAERLANLVTHQPAEVAKLRRLALDRLGVARDERVHGLLLQNAHGLLRPAQHQHRGGGIAALAEHGRLAGEETFENLAEDLVFAKQLVDRRALIEAQQPKLGRLRHHGRVGGNLLIRRRAQVGGNLLEQSGMWSSS